MPLTVAEVKNAAPRAKPYKPQIPVASICWSIQTARAGGAINTLSRVRRNPAPSAHIRRVSPSCWTCCAKLRHGLP